jgi:hypothetical protein
MRAKRREPRGICTRHEELWKYGTVPRVTAEVTCGSLPSAGRERRAMVIPSS